MSKARTATIATGSVGAMVAMILPFVMASEGKENDPYVDIAGVMTVCYGETNVNMRRYSDAECEAMLRSSLAKYGTAMAKCLPSEAPLSVWAGFTSLGYNIGTHKACNSTAGQLARARDYGRACQAMKPYNKVRVWGAWPTWCKPELRYVSSKGLRYCIAPGLVKRRAKEIAICESGL